VLLYVYIQTCVRAYVPAEFSGLGLQTAAIAPVAFHTRKEKQSKDGQSERAEGAEHKG
jgi:hypothetical protein